MLQDVRFFGEWSVSDSAVVSFGWYGGNFWVVLWAVLDSLP